MGRSGARLALLEGNRGLFDGMDVRGSCATAELTRTLDCPVLLSLDCTKMTRTAAALVAGVRNFEPGLRLAGVVLNQVASARHEGILREAITTYTDVPVLGAIPRLRENPLPERHMGLALLCGDDLSPQAQEILEKLADVVRDHVDMDRVLSIADDLPALPEEPDFWDEAAWAGEGAVASSGEGQPVVCSEAPAPAAGAGTSPRADAPRIGYVRDRALWFYYEENLEALRRAGAELVRLSLLDDAAWPELDGLYLGGGFPEDWARELSASPHLARLGTLAAKGLPIYAECGGFMVLASALERDGQRWPMSGIFPVETRFCPKPQGLGYVRADVVLPNPYFPQGSVLRGHEFHYSLCHEPAAVSGRLDHALRLRKGTGMGRDAEGHGRDGLVSGRVWAAYCHIFAPAVPGWAPRFVELARCYRQERTGGEKRFLCGGRGTPVWKQVLPLPPHAPPFPFQKLLSGGVAGYGGPADRAAAGTINGQEFALSGFDERKGSVPGILAPGTLPFLLWGNGGCGKGAVTGGSPKSLPMVDAGVLRGPAAEIWGSPQCVLCVPKNGSG